MNNNIIGIGLIVLSGIIASLTTLIPDSHMGFQDYLNFQDYLTMISILSVIAGTIILIATNTQ